MWTAVPVDGLDRIHTIQNDLKLRLEQYSYLRDSLAAKVASLTPVCVSSHPLVESKTTQIEVIVVREDRTSRSTYTVKPHVLIRRVLEEHSRRHPDDEMMGMERILCMHISGPHGVRIQMSQTIRQAGLCDGDRILLFAGAAYKSWKVKASVEDSIAEQIRMAQAFAREEDTMIAYGRRCVRMEELLEWLGRYQEEYERLIASHKGATERLIVVIDPINERPLDAAEKCQEDALHRLLSDIHDQMDAHVRQLHERAAFEDAHPMDPDDKTGWDIFQTYTLHNLQTIHLRCCTRSQKEQCNRWEDMRKPFWERPTWGSHPFVFKPARVRTRSRALEAAIRVKRKLRRAKTLARPSR